MLARIVGDQGQIVVGAGARGHAAHGLTTAQADDFAQRMKDHGFDDIEIRIIPAKRRPLIVIAGRRNRT